MAEDGDGGRRDRAPGLGARFAQLWAASTTSALGSGLAVIAAPLYVASRTTNPLIVSGGTGAAWLPWLLFALPGGVLVDRVDRRRLMVTPESSQARGLGPVRAEIAEGFRWLMGQRLLRTMAILIGC